MVDLFWVVNLFWVVVVSGRRCRVVAEFSLTLLQLLHFCVLWQSGMFVQVGALITWFKKKFLNIFDQQSKNKTCLPFVL